MSLTEERYFKSENDFELSAYVFKKKKAEKKKQKKKTVEQHNRLLHTEHVKI